MSESERILTRPVLTLLLVMVSFGMDFMMFLSVGPRLVEAAGAPAVAGFLTSTMLLSTVITRFIYPHLEARIHVKLLGVIAVTLMGAGALFFFVVNAEPIPMFIAALLRGVGFGIITVLAQGLVVTVSSPSTRGRVAGFIGVFSTFSSVLGPMIGLSLLDFGLQWAPGTLAACYGLFAALLLISLKLPKNLARTPYDKADTLGKALRHPRVLGNVLTLLLCSVAWAGVASFMPLVLDPEVSLPAQYFLLIYFFVVAATRYVCGQFQDRRHISDLTLIPAVLGIALSMFIIGFFPHVAAGVVSAVLAGVSMGWMQNMTFYSVLNAPGPRTFVLSAAWTNGIDSGGLLGTLVLSSVAAAFGLQLVPYAIALLALLALVPVGALVTMERRASTNALRAVETTV